MRTEFTRDQITLKESFSAFVEEEIVPCAGQFDRDERVPPEIIRKMAEKGYLGATLPETSGGGNMDMLTFGLLCEAIGKGSSSLLSLIAVHGMVSHAIMRWGSSSLRVRLLPELASGRMIGAFALTEPETGSDAKSVRSTASGSKESFVLNGRKNWISWGQIADVFLVLAKFEGNLAAFLIEKENPGISISPVTGMLGFRSAMLAGLTMEQCSIPSENLVGTIGTGFSHVCGTALDIGRYCIAWGCVGLMQACLDASIDYAREREQGDLNARQLILEMIAEMVVNTRAARLLCCSAGHLRNSGDPGSIMETNMAKYFASRTAVKAALDAIRIQGVKGCDSDNPVARYFRDAKVMETIEGSTQIQQNIISSSVI